MWNSDRRGTPNTRGRLHMPEPSSGRAAIHRVYAGAQGFLPLSKLFCPYPVFELPLGRQRLPSSRGGDFPPGVRPTCGGAAHPTPIAGTSTALVRSNIWALTRRARVRLRVALRYGILPEADGTHRCVVAIGGIVAFRPGMPAPQPLCAALFLLGMLIALPEVRFFALTSVPAGIAVGFALHWLRKWRQRHFPVPSVDPLGL